MNGILTKTGTQFFLLAGKPEETRQVGSAWCVSADLMPGKPGAKSRAALVWLNTYGQSIFDRVCIRVRVSASLDQRSALVSAVNKAHGAGKPYSWIMFARKHIKENFPALEGDADFREALRRLNHEWIPRESEEGRAYLSKVLKLPSFEAGAFAILAKFAPVSPSPQ